jgi:hypothetical protein
MPLAKIVREVKHCIIDGINNISIERLYAVAQFVQVN